MTITAAELVDELKKRINAAKVRYFYQSLVDYAERNAAAADQRAAKKPGLIGAGQPGGDQ